MKIDLTEVPTADLKVVKMKSLEKGKKNRDKEEAKSVEPRIELFSNAAGLISKALKNKSVERKNDEKNESSEGKS